MKTKMNKTGIMGITLKMTLLLNIFLLGLSCEDKPVYWEPKNQDLVITDYVLAHDDDFSEFSKVLNYTGIDNLLRVRGPFTLLLPTDEGMKEYYADLNVTDYTQIEMDVLTTMVKNHIFTHEITTASIGLGTLPYANANGDNVASDLPDIEIVLNKTATIIHRDIDVSNGYIQEIDKVLKPVTKNVIEVLDSYEGYSIFIEGLARTGLEDTLKIIEFPFGNATARAWFTILAVPDTLFNRFGIYTIDDLINKYSDSGDLTDRENGFYKYMLYHCLSEANYFSDFAPRDVYYLISYDNYLNIRVEKDFKINKTDSSYTGFYFDLSNIPAKNGAIHTINSLLPYIESDPEPVLFQTTDFFDIKQGPYYHNFYESFYDGQNTFKELKWDGEYLMYYIKPGHFLMDDDAISMNGHFWVELTTPKIMKGKYMLQGHFFNGPAWAKTSCEVDGKYVGIADPETKGWGTDPIDIAEVNFEVTQKHTIKLSSLEPGQMFWDYVLFTPIE